MSNTITQINLLPVSRREEVEYLKREVLKMIKPMQKVVDDYGAKYKHDTPWQDAYSLQPQFYLYRVTIGAVGRVNSCAAAVQLGLVGRTPAKSHHFTSMALYYVFRLARQTRRRYLYLKQLDKWLQSFIAEKNANSRFLEYNDD